MAANVTETEGVLLARFAPPLLTSRVDGIAVAALTGASKMFRFGARRTKGVTGRRVLAFGDDVFGLHKSALAESSRPTVRRAGCCVWVT